MFKHTENDINILLCNYLKGIHSLTVFDIKPKKSLSNTITVQLYSKKTNKLSIELRASILMDGVIGIKLTHPESITVRTNAVGYDLVYYTLEEIRSLLNTTFQDIERTLLRVFEYSIYVPEFGGLEYA